MSSLPVIFEFADAVLRGELTSRRQARTPRLPMVGALILAILGYGMFYGGVMGSYGGVSGLRFWQLVYSAVKVPILLVATFLLSMPSFLVLNTLFGLRDDFPRVARALLATQVGLTVILCSLAPFTAFWYISGSEYHAAILFNGMMFGVASFSAQWMLRRDYAPLIRSNPKHRYMLYTWLIIYVFVGIQLGWVLRPFVGNPRFPVEFFREGSWSNAYEVVIEMIWNTVAGRNQV
jgi:hypothetical protein